MHYGVYNDLPASPKVQLVARIWVGKYCTNANTLMAALLRLLDQHFFTDFPGEDFELRLQFGDFPTGDATNRVMFISVTDKVGFPSLMLGTLYSTTAKTVRENFPQEHMIIGRAFSQKKKNKRTAPVYLWFGEDPFAFPHASSPCPLPTRSRNHLIEVMTLLFAQIEAWGDLDKIYAAL